MAKTQSKHPALILREDLLAPNWTPSNTSSYDPTVEPGTTDASGNDGLSMNRGWFDSNGYSLHTAITNPDGGVIDGGETGYTAQKGDGSGPVQLRDDTLLVTVFAETTEDGETATYNGELASDIAFQIGSEVERILHENAQGGTTEWDRVGTTGVSETPQPDDDVIQRQAVVSYGWLKE